MMIYTVNEGVLTLPFEFTDSSITILKFPGEKSSLTIVRGEILPEISLDETVAMQRNLFEREFKTIVLGENKKTKLGSTPQVDGVEFYCMFDKLNLKQYQMNLLIKQNQHFITFSYTQSKVFTNEDLLVWEHIKNEFIIASEWYQNIKDEEHE